MIEYSKRLVEVDEILRYLSPKEFIKIPKDVINAIKENKDKNYIWKYDESKKLKEQNVSDDTIAILSYLNMEYLLNDKQKEYMQKIHQMNNEKVILNNELFKKKNNMQETKPSNETKMVVYQENILTKTIDKFKNFVAKLKKKM